METMRFLPVYLPEGRELEKRASQTLLRSFNGCPRSGYLYARDKGSVQTVEMARGSALHAVCERGTNLMIENGESELPPELVKVLVNEALAEYPVPIEEHDYIREMSWRWASEWTLDPEAVVGCETLFVLEIDGWQVRAKVDFAELRNGGAQVYVADLKSAKGAVTMDEVSRKRPDGTIAAKNLQLIVYALAVVYGTPVRVERCPRCGGTGTVTAELFSATTAKKDAERQRIETKCPDCRHGRVETIEPLGVAPRAQEVIAEFIYPGIEDSEGRMLRRTMGLTRLELEEYRESLGTILARLDVAERTGDWPAVISDAACGECPCPSACPIPVELRDHRGEINTVEQAAEALEVLDRRKRINSALRREVKEFAKSRNVEIRFGGDKVAKFVVAESDRVDKDGLFAAVERAVTVGEPFERSDFVKHVVGTNFKDVTLSEDELEEEKANQREVNDGAE